MPILKGASFAERLRAVCGSDLPVTPLADARYQRILIPGITGGELHWAMMGFIGQALRMRGAEVTALLCDAFLPACVQRKVDHFQCACTRWCHSNAAPFAEAIGLPHRWYSSFVSADERDGFVARASEIPGEAIQDFQWQGIHVGTLVTQSVESAFKVGKFRSDDPAMAESGRRFIAAAMCLHLVAERALDELNIEKVVMDNGRLVDWGVFRAVANARGIPVDISSIGLRGTSLRFEIDRPGQNLGPMSPWERWRDLPLSAEQEAGLERYLTEREQRPYTYRDDRWVSTVVSEDEARKSIGLPDDVDRVFAMFPNVGFDAGKTRSSTAAFEYAGDWLVATIEAIRRHPGVHLVIKGHPSEQHRVALDSALDHVRHTFAQLPANVHLVQPDTDISAHALIRIADCVLVYTSTVAAEAAALGKPVILVGGGWHASRGIATEAHSRKDYAVLLEDVLADHTAITPDRETGRRYAYALFFRNDIPVRHFEMSEFNIKSLSIDGFEDLAPGRDPSMDAICRGVLLDEPFENPEVKAG